MLNVKMFPSKISLAEINILWWRLGTYLPAQAAPPSRACVFAGHTKPSHEESNNLNTKNIGAREIAKVMFSKQFANSGDTYTVLLQSVPPGDSASLNDPEDSRDYHQQVKNYKQGLCMY